MASPHALTSSVCMLIISADFRNFSALTAASSIMKKTTTTTTTK